jgi:hypothetical protein
LYQAVKQLIGWPDILGISGESRIKRSDVAVFIVAEDQVVAGTKGIAFAREKYRCKD